MSQVVRFPIVPRPRPQVDTKVIALSSMPQLAANLPRSQDDFEELKAILAYELRDLRVRLVREIGHIATARLLRTEAYRALTQESKAEASKTSELTHVRRKMVSVGSPEWAAQQLRAEAYEAQRE